MRFVLFNGTFFQRFQYFPLNKSLSEDSVFSVNFRKDINGIAFCLKKSTILFGIFNRIPQKNVASILSVHFYYTSSFWTAKQTIAKYNRNKIYRVIRALLVLNVEKKSRITQKSTWMFFFQFSHGLIGCFKLLSWLRNKFVSPHSCLCDENNAEK